MSKTESRSKHVLPKKLPWFRMYCEFLEDPKMMSLAFEDQRHFIGILALKGSGVIDQECSDKIMNKIVAQKLWIGHDAIDDVKRRLIEAELIDSKWNPVAWGRRQFVSDFDPSGAERQKKYREKHSNALRNAGGDASVTLPDTDTDTDKTSHKKGNSAPKMAGVNAVKIDGKWREVDENGEVKNV